MMLNHIIAMAMISQTANTGSLAPEKASDTLQRQKTRQRVEEIKVVKVHENAYLNDCQYCIYFSFCLNVKRGKGLLTKDGCVIVALFYSLNRRLFYLFFAV
jgi:hypothetical protein